MEVAFIRRLRQALDALAMTRAANPNQGDCEWGYVTRNVTKAGLEGLPAPQVIEYAGGDDGARTRDLMRDSSVTRFHTFYSSLYLP